MDVKNATMYMSIITPYYLQLQSGLVHSKVSALFGNLVPSKFHLKPCTKEIITENRELLFGFNQNIFGQMSAAASIVFLNVSICDTVSQFSENARFKFLGRNHS